METENAVQTGYSASEAIEGLRNDLKYIISRYEANEDQVKHLEAVITDIKHEIEFSNYNASQACEIYQRLREVLRDRRKLKNENEALETAYKLLVENKTMLNKLDAALGAARCKEESQRTRVYGLRSTIGVVSTIKPCNENNK